MLFNICTYITRYSTWYLNCLISLFFFFKQKTAYDMRISDWSSDVCSSDLQGHAALAVPLDAGDFRTAETTAAGDADAAGAQPHGRLHRTLHGAAEGNATLELLRDITGDQLGIQFRRADLDDVQRHQSEKSAVGKRGDHTCRSWGRANQ